MAVKQATDALFKQFGYWWFRVGKKLYGPIKDERAARKSYQEKQKRAKKIKLVDSWRP